MRPEGKPSNKVGLVGTGMVGSSFAYALMQHGVANELILVDQDSARAEGEAMDLSHGLPFVRPMQIRAGDYADLAGSEVVVICAGANQRPGETRLDLLQKNAAVFRDVVPKIRAAAADAILVVATNPVDILTSITAQIVGPETGAGDRLGNDPRHGAVPRAAQRALRGGPAQRSRLDRGRARR